MTALKWVKIADASPNVSGQYLVIRQGTQTGDHWDEDVHSETISNYVCSSSYGHLTESCLPHGKRIEDRHWHTGLCVEGHSDITDKIIAWCGPIPVPAVPEWVADYPLLDVT